MGFRKMKVIIKKIEGKNISFIQEGKSELQNFPLAEWVKPEYVKLGEAEITITEGQIAFCTLQKDVPKSADRYVPKKAVSKPTNSESFGEFKANEIVNIKGKNHVIYEGLLRLAHQKGLKSFEIIDKFVSSDMKIAWVQVRAHVTIGDKSIETFFDGIGSSTPENTGTMTEHHPVEMAHTRAKGRALRDFLNIGQAMAEEIKQ